MWRAAPMTRWPGASSANVQQATARPDVACSSGRGRGSGFNSRDGLLLGGPGGRDAPSNQPIRKLVLPGSSGPPMGGGRLVIPDKNVEQKLIQGAEALGPEVVTPTGPNRYRPPAGFMNETPDDTSQVASMPPDLMISKLRSRAGKWHFLAKMLPQLALAGYDNNSVDELTGITPVIQSRWMVAATVYDSLVASGKMSEEQLEKFDRGGDELLYPFRFLGQEMRVEAAEYILANELDAPKCEILSRSMKEWERRPLERHGFSERPGDCMAFKYVRDAYECNSQEEAEAKLQEAMGVAVTDGARGRVEEAIQDILGEDDEATEAADGISGLASLTVLRLDPEDIGFRPIPLLGQLGQATLTELETAPRTTQDGAFGAFSIDGQGAKCRWVALPQWKALAMMRHPVALSVQDCSTVQAMIDGMKIKTDDDKRRLVGPGLVLADKCQTDASKVDVGSYYLALSGVPGSGGKLQLLEGAMVRARGLTALATVAFVARPPAREQPLVASPESSLIQL